MLPWGAILPLFKRSRESILLMQLYEKARRKGQGRRNSCGHGGKKRGPGENSETLLYIAGEAAQKKKEDKSGFHFAFQTQVRKGKTLEVTLPLERAERRKDPRRREYLKGGKGKIRMTPQ